MREAALPNFFVVGTGKAGTTSLYHYLRPPLRKLLFRRGSPIMDAKDRQYLLDYYREDITNLALLLNRDLSAWLC